MQSKPRLIVRYSVLGVAGLLAILLAALALMDWDLFKRPIARAATGLVGRPVSISGHLHVHLWSSTPTLIIEGLRVDNPPWESSRPLLQLQRLQVQIELRSLFRGHLSLRRIEVDQPTLYLHQEISGRANWTNANTAPTSATAAASKPFNLPAIRELIINSGTLVLIDDPRRLQINGTIQAHEHSAVEDPQALHIQAQGTINNEPFALDVSGGALLAVNPEHPYPFKLSIKAAKNEIDAGGEVVKPFNLGQIELQVAAHGPDLAQLYDLTKLALPNTPPYQLQAHISRDGNHFTVRDIKGLLGRSDIGGSVEVDSSHNRPTVTANLNSTHLFLSDLGALTGSRAAAPAARSKMLLPDAHLETARLRAMDGDVQFRATSIEAGKVPFTKVDIHARLKDGVLAVDPLQFTMPEGRLSGVFNIDARQDVPAVRMDVRATNVNLDQLSASGPNGAPLSGVLQARVLIKGNGDSVHNLMDNADGSLVAVIPHGDIRSAFAELTGIDLAGLGLLLTKNNDRAPIRCGVARFDLMDGVASAQSIVLDTQKVLITGSGKIDMASEVLDLKIQGQPKKFHLVRVRAPVDIKGHLAKPSFLPDKTQLLKQGAVAAALGTLLTPVASLLAFVDPGLAKDQDCSQLLEQAHAAAQAQTPAAAASIPSGGTTRH
jgi:AsmA family protein